MKNIKKRTKINEENISKIINNCHIATTPRISQLNHNNYYKNISLKKPIINKEIINNKISKCKISKKVLLIPKRKKNKKINNKGIINKDILSNNIDLNFPDANKQKILIFPLNRGSNDESGKSKNHSVENAQNRIYVHKNLKTINNNNQIKTSRNNNSRKEIKYENMHCQTNRNKDSYYSKLIEAQDRPFRKKNLSEIETLNSNRTFQINNMKLNRSPLTRNRNTFFNFPTSKTNNDDEEENVNEFNSKESNNVTIRDDILDELDDRLHNINDYINIYSIYNKKNEKENENENEIDNENDNEIDNENDNEIDNDNDNDNEYGQDNLYNDNNKIYEGKKIFSKKKYNNNNHLFINRNKINNIKDDSENKEKKNTININKNIIINKKIILIPDRKKESKNCSKTSYKFFNTYTNKYKNIINLPYSNITDNYRNINYIDIDNFGHSKTKPALTNFVYKKKNFISPSPKNINYINYFTDYNNNSSSDKELQIKNNQTMEAYPLSNTLNKFYGLKKNNTNIECLSNRTLNNNSNERKTVYYYNLDNNKNNNNIKCCLTKGRIKKDIYHKFNLISKNKSKKNINNTINNSNNILIINENENDVKLSITNNNNKLSLLELSNMLEKELKLIINKITKYHNCKNECYQFINYYLDNNFYQDKIKLFNNVKNKEMIKKYTKIEMIILFLCYDILCGKKFYKEYIILKNIFSLIYDNFILSLILIIKNSKNEDKKKIKHLSIIINEYLSLKNLLKFDNINENDIIETIVNNYNECINYYQILIDSLYKKHYNEKDYSIKFPNCIKNIDKDKNVLNKIKNVKSSFFIESYKKTQYFTFDELKKFFYSFLSNKIENIPLSQRNLKIKETKLNNNIEKPILINKDYLLSPIKNNYKYTLILNLNETLVYFKNQNTFILRQNIYEFLHEMKLIYELIILSDNPKEYAEPIIDIIQKKEKYFSYILYNKCIITNNKGEKLKDLNLLGREMKNLIVIDITNKYYKLNKENVICIKSFNGDGNKDKNTLKILGNFLKELQNDSEKTGDIRISLNKLKYKLYLI